MQAETLQAGTRNPGSVRLPAAVLLLAAAIVLAGFALRVHWLDAKDMWMDEAHVWWHSSLPLLEGMARSMAEGPSSAATDPLYGILMHFWIGATGKSVFAMRYFSVLTHTLSVALLGWTAIRAFGRRAGVAALAIGAVAPVWVMFSQEIRPYALTPLMMLILTGGLVDIARSGGRRRRGWIMLAAGEVLALYTHGLLAIGVAGINLLLAWMWVRKARAGRGWKWLRSWIITQASALALLAPLVPVYIARVGFSGNPLLEPISTAEFISATWEFLLGIPWENRLDGLPQLLPVLAVLVLMLPALALALRRGRGRLLANLTWLVLALAALMMVFAWRNTAFHGRYLLFVSGPLFLVLAGAMVLSLEAGWPGWLVSGGLAAGLAISSVMGLGYLYTGAYSGYRHHASQAVSRTLKSELGAQDGIIVMAVNDYTLDYYGYGDAALGWARFNEAEDTPEGLLAFMRGKQRIGVLRLIFEHADLHRHVPFYLERYGSLVERHLFEGYLLEIYALDAASHPELAAFEPASLNWGTLRLVEWSVESGDAVTLAARIQLEAALAAGTRYALSVRLVDPQTGWVLGAVDNLLVDEKGRPTSVWEPGQQVTAYFVLPLQPGTPPIEAEVRVVLYDQASGRAVDLRDAAGAPAGQEGTLGRVRLGPAPEVWAYPESARPWHLMPVQSDVLAGYMPDTIIVAPGEMLGLTLGWLAAPDAVVEAGASVQLVQGDEVLTEEGGAPLQGRQPASVQAGQVWLDRRVLEVSRNAQPGPAELVVWYGDARLVLGSIEVTAVERLMQAPAVETPLEATFGTSVRLLGYRLDAPSTLTSADALTLTLYWQALADGTPNANYKVFAHILNPDGALVGQHDGVPVNGTRPFSGWLAGEYLVDEHVMQFSGPYSGPIRIQVGLYDPETLQRVLTTDGRDAVVLPLTLQVESSE